MTKQAEYSKRYRERHPEKVRAARVAYQRKYILNKKYGLTPAEYALLIANGCEVCGSHEKMCADHDHETGKVRGALCMNCNTALGHAKDDIDRLLDLANYLREHQ